MLSFMLVLLIVLFIFNYWLSGRDFFAPTTIQILTFIVASIACIIFFVSNSITYRFHLKTVLLVVGCLVISTVVGIFFSQLFRRLKVHDSSHGILRATPISFHSCLIVILIETVTIVWMLSEIQRIGGKQSDFTAMMNSFHALNSYSTDSDAKLPLLLRQLRHLSSILFAVFGFNLIKFFKTLSTRDLVFNVVVIFMCAVVGLLGGARTPIVNMIIACLVMFHLLLIQKRGKYRTYKLGTLIKFFMIICVVLWGFSLLRGFVGRTNQMTPLTYITYYIGQDLTNLDMYLQSPIVNTDIWGKYTFYNLWTNLRTLGFNIKPYIMHLEFRSVNGITTGNVYTFIRTYYSDFGLLGVFVLHILASSIASAFYEYVKKRRNDIGILIFSLGYYSIVLSFFAERFFSTLISISFAEDVVISLLLYKLLIEKVVRISYRKNIISLKNNNKIENDRVKWTGVKNKC